MAQFRDVHVFGDILSRNAEILGDKTALIFNNQSWTYAELDRRANQVAHALIAEGIAPQSRVAFLGKDSDALVDLLFGCARADVVSLGINWKLAAPEVGFIINDAQAEILFVGQESFATVEKIADSLPSIKKIIRLSGEHPNWPTFASWRDIGSSQPCNLQPGPQHNAVQMYTSGTTGHPKGVCLAHGALLAINKQVEKEGDPWLDWGPHNVSMLNIPLFHIGGLWWLIQSMTAGATCVLVEAFLPARILPLLAEHRVTKICMVPAMLRLLMSEPGCAQTDFSSLAQIVYGGSPIPPAMLKEAMSVFGCGFIQIYGMTETGNCAVTLRADEHNPDSPLIKAAGRALPGAALKVINKAGEILPPGEIGEVCISSPGRMAGYWKRDEATAATLQGEWIHSGDAGYLDENGYLFICDRVKDMIIYAGENVYPAEIENVLYEHEAVKEVAVIGVPDDRWGESIKAVVVLHEGVKASKRQLMAYTKGKIADFKMPKSVDFIDALPRTPSGKVRKGELRKPYWQERDRQVN